MKSKEEILKEKLQKLIKLLAHLSIEMLKKMMEAYQALEVYKKKNNHLVNNYIKQRIKKINGN